MRITADLSGLDDATDIWERECWNAVGDTGRNAVQYAKEHGEYKNRTHDLRNAPGYAVVKDGKIIEMEVPADGNHQEAKHKTESFINNTERPQNGLILADGMPYASFVENKGFDVLGGATLHAYEEIKEILSKG